MTLTFLHMLRRSLSHRRARSLSALTALSVSAAVATALLTLYADLDTKLHKEFRSFGANIVVTIPTDRPASPATTPDSPPTPETLPAPTPQTPEGHGFSRAINQPAAGASALPKAALLAAAQAAAGPEALSAAFAYAVATTDRGTPVVVAGVDFDAVRKLDSWWQLPAWPSTPNAALLGDRAAQFVANENSVTLTYAGKAATFAGAGRLKTGGDEDSRMFLPQSAFEAWTGVQPTVLELQVPGGAANVEAALARIRRQAPGVQATPVRQLVEGESRIVDRTHALMYAAVLLIALTVAVSVLATMSASILERRRDFALMKALGGSHLQMLAMFLLEAGVIALAGVAAGFLLGSAAAWAISELNFHTASLPRLGVLPLVLLLNLAIAAAAALFPARILKRLQPAALLRGE